MAKSVMPEILINVWAFINGLSFLPDVDSTNGHGCILDPGRRMGHT